MKYRHFMLGICMCVAATAGAGADAYVRQLAPERPNAAVNQLGGGGVYLDQLGGGGVFLNQLPPDARPRPPAPVRTEPVMVARAFVAPRVIERVEDGEFVPIVADAEPALIPYAQDAIPAVPNVMGGVSVILTDAPGAQLPHVGAGAVRVAAGGS